jgi:hypothetical protein
VSVIAPLVAGLISVNSCFLLASLSHVQVIFATIAWPHGEQFLGVFAKL